jgi:hypothetical protein
MKKEMTVSKDRPKKRITLEIPADVLEDLERVARDKEMAGSPALIRYYIGQGLRKDMVELRRKNSLKQAEEILEKHKIDPKIIDEVIAAVG